MPYINKMERKRILKRVKVDEYDHLAILTGQIHSCGELNYAISELINIYFLQHGQNYRAINDVMGALEGAKCEFYRRVAVPYENQKIEENGDVYVT